MMKMMRILAVALFSVLSAIALVNCGAVSADGGKTCKHENLKETIIEATCVTDGQKKTVCLDCGYEFPTEKIPALGHDLEVVEERDATCLSPKIIVKKCSRCDEIVEEYVGEALEHDFVEVSHIDATCADAEKINYECTRCHAKKTETPSNGQGALGHNYLRVASNDTEATCTESGGIYYECERCGDHYLEVIAPKGHLSDGNDVVVEPTCTEKGYTRSHCSVCGEDYKRDFTEALGHDLVPGEDGEASCAQMGYKSTVCSRCDYEIRSDAVANTAHSFKDGVCEYCGKKAAEAFALTCEDSEIYAIAQNGSEYTVYAPSYVYWSNIKIQKEVLQGLYEAGVYSLNIYLGSNADNVVKAMACKVQGGEVLNLNVAQRELKLVKTYVFADADGLTEGARNGIDIAVYYRERDELDAIKGKNDVSCYAIRFEYVYEFDINNADSYLKTSMRYTYNAEQSQFSFTDVNTKGNNSIVIRKELLEYYYEAGYSTMELQLSEASGQKFGKNLTVYSNGEKIGTSGNTNGAVAKVAGIDLASVKDNDLKAECYCTDLYGTDWNPAEPMDKMFVKTLFMKSVKAYVESTGEEIEYTSEIDEEGAVMTFKFSAVPNNSWCYFYFNQPIVNEMIKKGYTQVKITLSAAWGYKNTAVILTNKNGISSTVDQKAVNGSAEFTASDLEEDSYYRVQINHSVGNPAAATDVTVKLQFIKPDNQ